MADDKQSVKRRFGQAILETSVDSAVWAGATATGGVPGLAVGAVAIAPMLTRIGHALLNHFDRRAAQILEPANDALGSDKVAELLEGSPALVALTIRAADEAARMIEEEYVDVLAAVLRDALAGKILVDTAWTLMDALSRMRPVTVVVLHHLGQPPEADSGHYDTTIGEHAGIPIGMVRGALRLLEEIGAVTAAGVREARGELWRIENDGTRLLSYLHEAGRP